MFSCTSAFISLAGHPSCRLNAKLVLILCSDLTVSLGDTCLSEENEGLPAAFAALTQLTGLSLTRHRTEFPSSTYEHVLGLPKLKQLAVKSGGGCVDGLHSLTFASPHLTSLEVQGCNAATVSLKSLTMQVNFGCGQDVMIRFCFSPGLRIAAQRC